jgi:2-keto-3-deoxy-L-fuconate dehydrogenase
MSDFDNANILVTGAASGIGAATARLLAERGARKLILVDLDSERLAASASSLGCETTLLAGDVADEAMWAAADLSGLTHAVANAGIGAGGRVAETSMADWRKVMSVNLDGVFLTLRAAMIAMKQGGGSIVLTASVAGVKAEPGIAAYGASKAAVIHLARIAAKEGGPDRIRVNSIAPGGVETPIWANVPFFTDLVKSSGSEQAAFNAMGAAGTAIGRFARADEIAEQIAFLLSEKAAYVTGSCFVSDGGYSL